MESADAPRSPDDVLSRIVELIRIFNKTVGHAERRQISKDTAERCFGSYAQSYAKLVFELAQLIGMEQAMHAMEGNASLNAHPTFSETMNALARDTENRAEFPKDANPATVHYKVMAVAGNLQ
jgi:hypothetical protein